MRVLVTGVGGPAGLSLAAQLRERSIWVCGVDMRLVGEVPLQAFSQVPAATGDSYIPAIIGLVERWHIDGLIPTVSEELTSLARHSADIPAAVVVADSSAVEVADDKFRTACALEAAGVPIPRFGLPSSFASAADAVGTLGGSIVIKPRVSRGGRGVRVIRARQAAQPEVAEFWSSVDDRMIVQKFASGIEYAPVLFRGADREISVCEVLQKTALREGIVGNALSVTRLAPGTGCDDVATVARAAVRALELTGPVDLDIRRQDDDTPVVLEVNARFGANSASVPELLTQVLSFVSARTADISRLPEGSQTLVAHG